MTVDIHFKTEIRNAVVLGVVATIYYYEQHGNFNMSRGRLQALDHIANTFDIFVQRDFILTSTVMCYRGDTITTILVI